VYLYSQLVKIDALIFHNQEGEGGELVLTNLSQF